MKIIFWNVYLRSTPESIWQAMQYYEATHGVISIWCFSESTPAFERLLKTEGFHTRYEVRAGEESGLIAGQHGIMIASRTPICKPRVYSLSEVQKKYGPHKTPLLLVEVMNGKQPITIATAHITFWGILNSPRRKQERRALLEYLPKSNTLFGGDLNSVLVKPIVWDLKSHKFQQLIRGVTWRLMLGRFNMPFWLQLDHVFATYDLSAKTKTKILEPAAVSDHRPVMVEISD